MLWKLYAWIFGILTLFGLVIIANNTPLIVVDILGVILNIILMVAAFAFAYNKKLLTSQIWKIFFWIVIVFMVETFLEVYILPKEFVQKYLFFMQSKLVQNPSEGIFSWILSLPAVYAIYRLGFIKK